VKSSDEDAVAPPVPMDIFPVVAPTGTVVEILVLVDETTVAATPLKVIVFDAPVSLKPVPLIVTAVPTFPDVGEKLVMANCGGDSSSSQEIKNKAKKKMLPVTRSPIAINRKYSTGEIFLSITGVFMCKIPPFGRFVHGYMMQKHGILKQMRACLPKCNGGRMLDTGF
jgi:hypothetical protein